MSYAEDAKLVYHLVNNDDMPQLQTIANLPEELVFTAKGINVDEILFIEDDKTNTEIYCQSYPIQKYFSKEFNMIKKYYYSNTNGVEDIIQYIIKTPLINASKSLVSQTEQIYFDYCITLFDRYMPKIYIDISYRLSALLEKKKLLDNVYKHERMNNTCSSEELDSLEKKYLNSQNELKNEVCGYVILWIHAYRFLRARQQLFIDHKNTITFSHRYQGWSNPRYQVNHELTIEIKTNFDYGNSSYFYLLLIFRGIQIFPFLEWVNYKYASVSEMQKYYFKYSKKDFRSPDNKNYQNCWRNTFRDIVTACNSLKEGSDKFIDKYIITPLNKLISELEKIINMNDEELNKKYRNFQYGFNTNKSIHHSHIIEKIKLINVKGCMISETLKFISEITKLQEIIKTEKYIQVIEVLNKRILVMLREVIPDCHCIIEKLSKTIQEYHNKLAIIWIDNNLKNLEQDRNRLSENGRDFVSQICNMNNIPTMKGMLNQSIKKENLTHQDVIKITNLIDKNYFKLKNEHLKLLKEKMETEQDLKHAQDILNSIKRYIDNITKYFANIHQIAV